MFTAVLIIVSSSTAFATFSVYTPVLMPDMQTCEKTKEIILKLPEHSGASNDEWDRIFKPMLIECNPL